MAARPEAAAAARPPLARRLAYLRRVLAVYLQPGRGPLAFWYETPELNPRAFGDGLGEYYMTFRGKAAYRGPFDADGIPLLDYRGDIGRQYNPIAIAQYGLAMHVRAARSRDAAARDAFVGVADWLARRLERNAHGLAVWQHHFDWPYRETLVAPWYSGLAQGQGVSLLVRAAAETGQARHGAAAAEAFEAFRHDVKDGGVMVRDEAGRPWIEEYLVDPPSHILNGFLWALWGVHDFWLWTKDGAARDLFEALSDTVMAALPRYDTGAWSLYELPAPGHPPMPASLYYHRLHVVQLRVMERLTGRAEYGAVAERWERYAATPLRRTRARARKAWFKLRHY